MAVLRDYTIFSGTSNPALAQAIAQILGVPLGKSRVERFPDGEIEVELLEPPRRKEVFIVQPTCPPVNDHLFELLAFTDACRRAAAGHITAIVPYFGYARSDKRHERRVSINASLVAALMQAAGVGHVVTVDLHAPQIEGFFYVPTDSLSAVAVLADALREDLPEGPVVISPDEGRVRMATRYAGILRAPVAVLHKERHSGAETSVLRVVGDVRGRHCLVVDDMISTGGTIASSVEALLQAGAQPDITVVATHGLFVPPPRRDSPTGHQAHLRHRHRSDRPRAMAPGAGGLGGPAPGHDHPAVPG